MTLVSGSVTPVLAISAVFAVMFALGLGIVARDLLWVRERPALLVRGLVSVLVAVPLLAVLVVQLFQLPRWFEIGLLLMAVSPGAPVALRRSLGAGGHRSFAPTLQLCVAALAVVVVPAWVAILNRYYYGGQAWVGPGPVARQVFIAQLLPLGSGIVVRHFVPGRAERLATGIMRLGALLLLAFLVFASVGLVSSVLRVGPQLLVASAVVTMLAVTAGHVLGGPYADTRTALAVGSAARNPGLALVVATVNAAPPDVGYAILSYLLVSALTLAPYVAWRSRSAV
jgi:bile acid:Na+ symporter, BASS family